MGKKINTAPITKKYRAEKERLEAQYEADMADAWHKNFPDGEYRLYEHSASQYENNVWSIHWIAARGAGPAAFTAYFDKNGKVSTKEKVWRPTRGWGKTTTYNSTEALHKGAERRKCPTAFVSSFIDQLDTYHKIQLLK